MKLIDYSKFLKLSFKFFIMFFLLDHYLIKSSDISLFSGTEKEKLSDFDQIFFKYSIPFEGYDSYNNQFDNFFGMNYLETEKKRNFQDLSVSNDSKEIRELYIHMLEDITYFEKIEGEREPFYKNKI